MTFRAYVLFMAAATVLAWVGWVLVLLNVNPREAGLAGLVFFYLTLSVSLLGTFALVGVLIRRRLLKSHDLLIREVKISFRHAVLLSLLAIASLIASSHNRLQWWVILLFIMVAAFVEYVALLIQKSHRG